MTAIFTNSFKAALNADVTLMDQVAVEMVMFSNAAGLVSDEEVEGTAPPTGSPYAAIDTIAGLEALLGWGPSIPQTNTTTMPGNQVNPAGTATHYIETNSIGWVLPAGFPTSKVKVVAFVYKGSKGSMNNKVMFITDTPVGTSGTVMYAGDGVIPQADPTRGRVFISWAADGVIEGSLVRTVGPKVFEPARTQHLWISPQRMNMIANPSFEEDVTYWRSNGAASQITTSVSKTVRAATTKNLAALTGLLTVDEVTLVAADRVLVKDQTAQQDNGVYVVGTGAWTRATDADSDADLRGMEIYVKNGTQRGETWSLKLYSDAGTITVGATPLPFVRTQSASTGSGNFAGHFAGKVVESNMFPLVGRLNEEGWTIQLRVRSDGEVKVGFIVWGPDFLETAADWGHPDERWLPSDGWIYVRSCRNYGEMSTGMLRVETQGSYLDIDLACVEFGTMPSNYNDWPYFDGSSLYGTPGDYSWYERPHKSYSCWYNDRTAVFGRLFDWNMSPEDAEPRGVFTDTEAAQQGLAHQWVPAGTPLIYHTDVLYPEDPRNPLPPVTGSVLPRQVNGFPKTAVPDAWVAREAYAGTPGTWGPVEWTSPVPSPPADFLALYKRKVAAYPISPWTTGQYVQTALGGEPGKAHWTGSEWSAALLSEGAWRPSGETRSPSSSLRGRNSQGPHHRWGTSL